MANYDIKNISLAPYGQEKIDWAYRNMPVLRDGLRIVSGKVSAVLFEDMT